MKFAAIFGTYRDVRLALAALFLFAGTPAAAAAPHEHQHDASSSGEFEVFVAGEGFLGSGQPHPRDDDSWFNADVIFGYTHDQFRVFGEYFITPEEHDMERFQVGYEFAADTVLWLGRFHQPGSAWNTEHHHGRYLQTAITRPSIENWEDEEGLIPQHIAGLLLETRQPLGPQAGLQFLAGAGASPAVTNSDGYQPIDVINNNPGKHGVSLTARLAYLPDYAGTSSAGLLLGHDQIYIRGPVKVALLQSAHAILGVYGAYADWAFDKWRIIAAGYYVDVQLDRPARAESFISGYLQAELQLPHDLTAYGRAEDSARMQRSQYVTLFDDRSGDIDINLRRAALGLRWDFIRRQAFSMELSHVTSLDKRAYEARFQWSAAIP